ncbi:MAG TPA: hypothetical protein VN622_05780 [Clostridia bacterium]|nr:hypothetical protein [Clostridia bacterium]
MARIGESRATPAAGAGSVPDPFGRMFTPAELAKIWNLSENSIRRMFQDRPGVFKMGDANPRGRRGYQTLRVPQAVAEAVFRERCR